MDGTRTKSPYIRILDTTATLRQLVLAANSFTGSNLYHAAGLSPGARETLLQMEDAGMKVLRVWLNGRSTATTNQTALILPQTTSITTYPGLEPNEIDVFNDTVLGFLDGFMLASKDHGIKLMISTYSFNALDV
ncbi:hypothetical protein ACEPAG_679 [Sanghuangporus baumii]